jgi:hypothetical protein
VAAADRLSPPAFKLAAGFVDGGFVDGGFAATGFVATGFAAGGFVAGSAAGVVCGVAVGELFAPLRTFIPRTAAVNLWRNPSYLCQNG